MLRCIWTFLSDPTNRATLGWIFSGVAAAIAGPWAAFQFWFKRGSPSKAFRLTVVMSIAVILIAGYWLWSEARFYCPDCYRSTTITIKTPLNNATISPSDSVFPIINGEATPSEVCRYVYVFVHAAKPNGTLIATDLTQTLANGDWSGRLDLGHVDRGGQADVHVILIDRTPYPVGTPLVLPPVAGRPSQAIQLWRQP